MIKGKRGLTLAEWIAIIALVIIGVVALIFFFSKGSLSFSDLLANILPSNKQSVITGCKTATAPDAWCCQVRTLRSEGKVEFVTCESAKDRLQLTSDISCQEQCGEYICADENVKSTCGEKEIVDKDKKLQREYDIVDDSIYVTPIPKGKVCCAKI